MCTNKSLDSMITSLGPGGVETGEFYSWDIISQKHSF